MLFLMTWYIQKKSVFSKQRWKPKILEIQQEKKKKSPSSTPFDQTILSINRQPSSNIKVTATCHASRELGDWIWTLQSPAGRIKNYFNTRLVQLVHVPIVQWILYHLFFHYFLNGNSWSWSKSLGIAKSFLERNSPMKMY